MPSSEAIAMKEAFVAWTGSLAGRDLDGMRASFGGLTSVGAPVEGVSHEDVDAGGVAAIMTSPPEGDADRALMFLHGGGYMLGAPEFYTTFCGHLSIAAGCRVLSVDYRLAPEHPFPAAVDDSVAAWNWLLGTGVDASSVAIVGDSAGGGLTLSCAMKLRDDGAELPGALVSISPFADMAAEGESMISNADNDVLIQQASVIGFQMMYAPDDATNPLASPLLGAYDGLPPTYFVVGGHETLLDDATRCAASAAAVGVDVTLDVFDEMQHDFLLGVGNVPESDDAVGRIGAFLQQHLG